jgi:hypothetical protein
LKCGAAAPTIKQWKFQKKMEFLISYMTNRQHERNLDDDSDYGESQQPAENVVTENLDTNDVEVQNVENDNLETGNNNDNEENINEIIEDTVESVKCI